MNRSMQKMDKLQQQFATGKKIQVPSDDPIVAGRALKLRTNVFESKQYQSNIRNAQSWMDVTEQALFNMEGVLTRISELSVQGATGTITAEDRQKVGSELKQLREQLLQEGNVNYAGRYVFSGFKTDQKLIFDSHVTEKYNIRQEFGAGDIEKIKITDQDVYRIRLPYKEIDDPIANFTINGSAFPVTTKQSVNADAYSPPVGGAYFIQDTGELIFHADDAKGIINNKQIVSMEYTKQGFKAGELNPEHYFTNFPYKEDKAQVVPASGELHIERIPIKKDSVTFNPGGGATYFADDAALSAAGAVGATDIFISMSTGKVVMGSSFTGQTITSIKYQTEQDPRYDLKTELNKPLAAGGIAYMDMKPVKEGTVNITMTTGSSPLPANIKYVDHDNQIPATIPATYEVYVSKSTGKIVFGSDFSGDIKSITYQAVNDKKNSITYEVGANNRMNINSIGNKVLTVDLMRDLDEIINKVENGGTPMEYESTPKMQLTAQGGNIYKAKLTHIPIKSEPQEYISAKSIMVNGIDYPFTQVRSDDIGGDPTVGNAKLIVDTGEILINTGGGAAPTVHVAYRTPATSADVGKQVSNLIGKIDAHNKMIVREHADLGSRVNRMDLTKNRLEADYINFTELMSINEDVDMAEVMIQLSSQEMIYKSSLMAGARIIQPTLLDFLR